MKILKIIIPVLVLLAACKNTQTTSQTTAPEPPAKDMADATGDAQDGDWERVKNANGQYTLNYEKKKTDVKQPRTTVNFYVTDSNSKKLYEGTIYGGYVKWYDSTKVEFFSPPGTMPADSSIDDYAMIYDIVMDKTYKKSSLRD